MTAPRTEPKQLGPYRLLDRIGEGGMGVVHLAVTPSGDLVAVKALRPWLVGGQNGRDRFERELASLRRVRGDRVAEVMDADVAADPPYIVTRYVRGSGLDKVVGDHGPLKGEALTRVAVGLAEALASVHAADIVHRDIKPGNVLITDDGPVLIDFGLARALDEHRLTATGMVIGTPGYLAPEVVAGHRPSPATDVHAWAATVAFAGTGRPPYGTGPDAVVLDRIRRGQHDLAGIEPSLAAVLNRALATDPGQRPSVAEIQQRIGTSDADVTAVVAPLPPTAPVASAGPPTRVDHAPPVPAFAPVPPAPAPQARPPEAQVPARPPVSSRPAAPPPSAARPVPAWTGPPGMAPPLRTWPARLAVGAGWLALFLVVAMAPRAGVGTVLVLMIAARTMWRIRRNLYERRLARGYQPSDHWVMAAGTPWHVTISTVQSTFHLAWISLAAFLIAAAVALLDLPNPRVPYLAGAAIVILLAWLGPATARIRNGVRLITAPLDRNPQLAWILLAVFIVVCWLVLLIWDSYGTGWPPLHDLPNPIDLVEDWFWFPFPPL